MYFQGLSIEILEDGERLREYCLQTKNTVTTTGKSYVIDDRKNERKYSPITVYAVVKETGKKFEIKYSAKMASKDNPIIAIVYVDGTNDYVYRGITSSSPQIQNSFWNPSRDKKYYFKFSEIPSSPANSRLKENRPINGARGTVSIYFYKGLKAPTRLTSIPHYTLNQSRMIEPKYKSEIRLTTRFEEAIDVDVSSKPIVNMIKQSNDPFAVLHIHYRSEPWLISIGMPINRDHENSNNSLSKLGNDQNEILQSMKDNSLSEIAFGKDVPKNQSVVEKNKHNEGTYVSLEKVRNVMDQLNQSIINLMGNLEINNGENLNKEYVNTNVIKPPADIIEIQDDDEMKHPNLQSNKRQRKSRKKWKKEKEEMTKRLKYKEYIEREYHTSDYIEFGDDDNGERDQILKKTICTEKTIINLEDSGEDE